MKVQEAAQDYLEAILVLSTEKDFVRAVDLCKYFGYSRPTVSVYIKQLKENNYIEINEKNHITLTKSGYSIAKDMYDRHLFLSKFFRSIGVPKEIALKDACRVEHYISAETYQALRNKFEG